MHTNHANGYDEKTFKLNAVIFTPLVLSLVPWLCDIIAISLHVAIARFIFSD